MFLLFCGLFFTFFTVPFEAPKFFILMMSHWSPSLCIVLALTLRLWPILRWRLYVLRWRHKLVLLHMESSCPSAICRRGWTIWGLSLLFYSNIYAVSLCQYRTVLNLNWAKLTGSAGAVRAAFPFHGASEVPRCVRARDLTRVLQDSEQTDAQMAEWRVPGLNQRQRWFQDPLCILWLLVKCSHYPSRSPAGQVQKFGERKKYLKN